MIIQGLKRHFLIPLLVLLEAAGALGAEPVSLGQLRESIDKHRDDVLEFRIIRDAANELSLRVWLFGGTAAGYAHYVKWDLARNAGDTRYVESRFDYDFTNIYRSTQDADLVVDGDLNQAEALEALIKEKLSHLQGVKSDWEVRMLRHDRGQKQALLNTPDFLEQHSDSNSTGMIELTDPAPGEGVVRDLRDWAEQESPRFLEDVSAGKISFYFSPTHSGTSFFRAGNNPPIFSVIRFLGKAFQYELSIREEDLKEIGNLIEAFTPEKDLSTDYAKKRFESLATRLVLHAANLEYAFDTLDRLSLRKKLIAASNPKKANTAGWWLNREPLRTTLVGRGQGKSLREVLQGMGVDPEKAVFSHETSDFVAWECMTRDTTGRPNALISRDGEIGETAVHGDGHYTRLGMRGARGTGFTVRYTADLEAREGDNADFTFKGDYFVFKNRGALRIIPESLNLSPLEFFEILAEGKIFSENDKGPLEKLRRRIFTKPLGPSDEARLLELAKKEAAELKLSAGTEPKPFFAHWFQSPWSSSHPEIVDYLLAKLDMQVDKFVSQHVLTREISKRRPDWTSAFLQRPGTTHTWLIMKTFFQNPARFDHPEWLDRIFERSLADFSLQVDFVKFILANPALEPGRRARYLRAYVDIGISQIDHQLVTYYFSEPALPPDPAEFSAIIKRSNKDGLQTIAEHAFRNPGWSDSPETADAFLERIDTFYKHGALNNPESFFVDKASRNPGWIANRDLIARLVARGNVDARLVHQVFSKPDYQADPEWIETILERSMADEQIALMLNHERWAAFPHWWKKLIERRPPMDLPQASFMPQLPTEMTFPLNALSLPHWRNHPVLRAACGGLPPTEKLLQAAIRKGATLRADPEAQSPSCDDLLQRGA